VTKLTARMASGSGLGLVLSAVAFGAVCWLRWSCSPWSTNRLTVAVPLTAAAVLPLTSMASSATTAFFTAVVVAAAGSTVPVAFLMWAVNSKLDSVLGTLRRDVKRQVDETNTELGADRASLIQQRGLLNHVRVNLAANEDVPDTP